MQIVLVHRNANNFFHIEVQLISYRKVDFKHDILALVEVHLLIYALQ